MKKVLSVIAVVVFLGALSAPVYSSNNLKPGVIQVNDEKPKKKTTKKEATKKSKKEATKGCASACGEKKTKACGDKDKK